MTGGGHTPARPAEVGGGETTITGTVVDATNVASPIADAYVYVPWTPSSSRALPQRVIAYGRTDAQGNYQLQRVPGGLVRMVVEPPSDSGFYPVQFDFTAPSAGTVQLRLTLLPKSVSVATVTVSPSSASLWTGDTQQFTATALNSGGRPVQAAPTWVVTGPIGSVTAEGLFTAQAAGDGAIVALVGDRSGSATVVARDGGDIDVGVN